MNLKRRLNWAAYIIFTLFVALTTLVQVYIVYQQLTTQFESHDAKLTQLVLANNSSGEVFDALILDYDYQRFSLIAPSQPPFKYVAETVADWPIIVNLFKPIGLFDVQTVYIDGTAVTYSIDFSDLLSQSQLLLISLIVIVSILYLIYGFIINNVIRRHVAQPLAQFAQALARVSEFHFGGTEPQDVIDEMKPISRALQKTRIELELKFKKLSSQNKQLLQEAFNDKLTGYGNRVLFNKDFSQYLNPEQKTVHTGLLCFVRTTQLGKINKEDGFQAGDEYISKIADHLRQSLSRIQLAQLYRINGADFAILLPNQAEENIGLFVNEFKTLLDDYQKTLDVESIAYTGIVNYRSGEALTDVLSSVDIAVSIAQTMQANGWHLHKSVETKGSQQWKETIAQVLKNTKINLFYQPIIPTRGEHPLYLDLFARFMDNDNKVLPTQSLIAMAQRHGSATDIDKLVIKHITDAHQAGRFKHQTIGVKLTTSSVMSSDFMVWLERHLLSNQEMARQSVFEINCNTVEQNHDNMNQIIAMLHKCGSKISLAGFGVTTLGFLQLKVLKPDFIKLDRSLTKDILIDKDHQFYVKQLVDVTQQLRSQVIIVGIETEEARFYVEELRVNGMQGYFIGEPANISELASSLFN